MAPNSPSPRRRWFPPASKGIREHLRGYFIAGILVTGPTLLTLYIIWLFIAFIDRSVGAAAARPIQSADLSPRSPESASSSLSSALTLIGALDRRRARPRLCPGQRHRIVARMPVVRGIYAAVKQIFETVLAKQSNSFREVLIA